MSKVLANSTGKLFTTLLSTRSHTWVADEPEESGGEDIGPTPVELLLGSLAACAVITAQMYAKRKEWPLESITVEADRRMLDAKDCPDCESAQGKVMEVMFKVLIRGPLSEEQRSRLFEIAGRCPVKRAVEGEVKFRSELL
jgi:putative redox protein